MKTRLISWLAGVAIALSAAAAQAEPLKAGFIYPSPTADVGWAKQLDLGREAIEKEFGDKVETVVVEAVPEGPDAARIMNQMVTDGAKFVMLGSFGYMNDGLRLARQQPDVAFIHASGFKQTDNFGTFTARNYEGFYLGGLAAGMVTKSNVIGMVAAFAIPEVVAEVVNDTFLVVWQKPGRYQGDGEVAAWLWGIAIRTLLHRVRARKSVVERLRGLRHDHVPSAEDAVLLGVEHGDVGLALERLSPELLAVVQATVLDGLSTRETAALLGIPAGTVKSRMSRARTELREALL